MDKLDPTTTALLLVDLQKGILQLPVEPHKPADIITRAAQLVATFRDAGSPIVLSRVTWSADFRDALQPPVDRLVQGPTPGPDWADFPEELGIGGGEIIVTKRQWGGFYGTELDLQLRRRGVKTIVLGGIATNLGVESTARDAWERGYHLVFVEDLMATFTPEMHGFAINAIFPMIGRIRSTEQVIESLGV